MIKNAINKIASRTANGYRYSSFNKRMIVLENVMNEQKERGYNPRKARHKSLKGILFTHNK